MSKLFSLLNRHQKIKTALLNPSLLTFIVGALGALYFYTPAPYLSAFFALLLMLSTLPQVSTGHKVGGSIVGAGLVLFDLAARMSVEIFRGWFGLAVMFLLAIAVILPLFRLSFTANKRWRIRWLNERFFPVPAGTKERDVWRLRAIYGVLSFGISAATLVTLSNWIEFAYLDLYQPREFWLFFLVQVGAILFLIQLYYLTRKGRWQWAVWGFNLLALGALFGGNTSVEALNDLLSIFVIPVLISIVLLGWQAGLAYGALVFTAYAWVVPPGSGKFNYFDLVSIALAGAISYFLILQLRAALRHQQLANLELQLAFQELQESKQKLELVILGVSHEIRTPLAAIGGITSILKMALDNEALTPMLESMDAGLARLGKLAQEMNDMAQGGNAGLDLNYEPVKLLDAVTAAVRAEKSKAQTITIEVDERIVLDADPKSLQQMLRALIENACLHGDGRVRVAGRVENDRVSIVVSDSGEGISKEELPQVFIPFMRGDRAIGKAGRGMGLTLTRLLAEAHGGGCWIESAAGEGCQAFVRLPLRQAKETD